MTGVNVSAGDTTVEAILLATLEHPSLLYTAMAEFSELEIFDRNLKRLRDEILIAEANGAAKSKEMLRINLDRAGLWGVCERLERRPMLKNMAMTRAGTPWDDVARDFRSLLARHHKIAKLQTAATKSINGGPSLESLERRIADLEATVARLRRLTRLDAIEDAEAMRPPGWRW